MNSKYQIELMKEMLRQSLRISLNAFEHIWDPQDMISLQPQVLCQNYELIQKCKFILPLHNPLIRRYLTSYIKYRLN